MLKKKVETLLEELILKVTAFYGERLVSLILFGSAARGTMRPDSDIDLLICAFPLPCGRRARLKEFLEIEDSLASSLKELRSNQIFVSLSPVIKTPKEVEFGSLIFLDMIDQAKILFDKNSFFKNYLNGLKQRLRDLGSRKIRYGNTWYWELVPQTKSVKEAMI